MIVIDRDARSKYYTAILRDSEPPCEPAYDADGHQKSAKPKAMPPGGRDFIAVPQRRHEERYSAWRRR